LLHAVATCPSVVNVQASVQVSLAAAPSYAKAIPAGLPKKDKKGRWIPPSGWLAESKLSQFKDHHG